MERENYWIDPRLKEGKHYPVELVRLIEVFNGGRVVKHVNNKRGFNQQEKEVREIEEMFKTYFLYQARMVKFQKYFNINITTENKAEWTLEKLKSVRQEFREKWKEEFPSEGPLPIIENIIKRINAKLKLACPQLLGNFLGPGFYLEPITIIGTRRHFLRDRGETFRYWELLARVIANLNPRLVHRCAYDRCGKIYLSRQGKKFHSECRSKYFSEKYGKEGRNAEKQRQYRLRNKKRKKARKHA